MKSLTDIFNSEARAHGQDRPSPGATPAGEPAQIKIFYTTKADLKTALPTRLKILNPGENRSTQGAYTVNGKTAASLVTNQKTRGFERVAIDFNHCSVPGTPANDALIKAGQPPLIFGYGRPSVIPGDGVYLEDITWTPLGVQHAKNFEDLSPALGDENGEVTFLHSVALCTNGSLFDTPTFLSQLATLSASQPTTGQRRPIDLASIFNAENQAATRARTNC